MARKKTPGGLLEVHLQLEAGRIAHCLVTGDFFAPEARVRELERCLRGTPAVAERIEEILGAFWGEKGAPIEGVSRRALAGVFSRAARAAEGETRAKSSYACFVNP